MSVKAINWVKDAQMYLRERNFVEICERLRENYQWDFHHVAIKIGFE